MRTSSENYPEWVEDLQFETNARGGWVVPAYTPIPCDTVIPPWSQLGTGCTLGDCCTLGNRCTLGACCTLGAEARWMGVTVHSWLTLSNVDGSGRQVKVVKHAEGVRVEAGCFQGTLEDFCTQAASEGKDRYVRVVSAVVAAM